MFQVPSRCINLGARLRYPLIKFRYGASREQHQTQEANVNTLTSTSKQRTTDALYDYELPTRFHRKPLSQEEIDYINRGGPE